MDNEEIVKDLMMAGLSKIEWKIVNVILEHGSDERIPLDIFEKETEVDKRNLSKFIERLEEKKIISTDGKGQHGGRFYKIIFKKKADPTKKPSLDNPMIDYPELPCPPKGLSVEEFHGILDEAKVNPDGTEEENSVKLQEVECPRCKNTETVYSSWHWHLPGGRFIEVYERFKCPNCGFRVGHDDAKLENGRFLPLLKIPEEPPKEIIPTEILARIKPLFDMERKKEREEREKCGKTEIPKAVMPLDRTCPQCKSKKTSCQQINHYMAVNFLWKSEEIFRCSECGYRKIIDTKDGVTESKGYGSLLEDWEGEYYSKSKTFSHPISDKLIKYWEGICAMPTP